MSLPSVSVLMVQWGATDLTVRALDAVRRSTYGGSVELLVWDNDSPDGPASVAAMDDLTLVLSETNVGFGPANNALAEQASGELLLMLNNDTIVAPDCLGKMVACLQGFEKAVAVAPQVRGFDGRIQELGGFVGPAGDAWQLMRGESSPRSLRDRPFVAHYGSAACLLVRRRDFLDAGGFDDLFAPAYYEDTDLCMRLTAGGGRVIVEPGAVVYHLEGGTAGTDLESGAKRIQLRNRGRFASRWASRLANDPPMGLGAAIRHALCPERGPLVLLLLPDFLKADQSGGHARVLKELEALTASGTNVAVWSEHVGDHGRYSAVLRKMGIAWFGYQEPTRWPLGAREGSCLQSLQDVLRLAIWDAVVAWSVDCAHRFGPIVREMLPTTPFVVDSAVLMYRQCERGVGVGAAQMEDLMTEKRWELDVYGSADAVIASSRDDALALREELPHLEVFDFDVGAYEPIAADVAQASGPLVFLGNFIHPPNLDAVIWWAEEIFPVVHSICGRPIPLRVVGASSELVLETLGPNPTIEVTGWVEDLGAELGRARAMIVPLRYGAGTKDKIAVGMRYGLPTVTTTIGAESMPDELERALLVADEPEQIAIHVVQMMTDDAAWKQTARATREAAASAWADQAQVAHRFVHWFSRFALRGHQ